MPVNYSRTLLRSAGALALTLAIAAPAVAYVPEKTPHRNAQAAARTMIAQPAARASTGGVLLMRGSRELFGLRADTPLAPASVLKLTTTTTAMIKFGPDHRFATRALTTGRGSNLGTLYFVGGGDPTLTTEAYRQKRYLPAPEDVIKRPAFPHGSATVEQLAGAIAARGVRHIGTLAVDNHIFDGSKTQAGWLPRYLVNNPDVGFIDGLTINEGYGDLDQKTLVPSPALAAGSALANALSHRGVTVGRVAAGRAGRGAHEVARVESPTVAEIVDFTNRYSINYNAEILLKDLGASFGGRGSTAAGVAVVRKTLRALGVPTRGLVMTDASGLSVLDRVTPRTVAGLLERIITMTGPAGSALRASIPVAGEPGTLLKRLTGPLTKDKVHGKTGQIEHVRSMAGWVMPLDGVPIVYVAIFNNVRRPTTLTKPLDVLGFLLALFPGT
jgi:D-alanyl-D-alanine carboxypeptidase/D-alanyl-D-alanine-endopeptidase (penicillin-binding protein 4)